MAGVLAADGDGNAPHESARETSVGYMDSLDGLLTGFVANHRMKLPGAHYEPCYRILT